MNIIKWLSGKAGRTFAAAPLLGRLLCNPFASLLGKRITQIRRAEVNPTMLSAKTGLRDKSNARQLLAMMSRHARNLADGLCNLLNRHTSIIVHQMQQHLLLASGQLSDWFTVLELLARIIQLRSEVCYVRLQSLYLRFRLGQLGRKRVALSDGFVALKVEQANLLAQHVGNSGISDAFQNRWKPLKHTMCGNRPNI